MLHSGAIIPLLESELPINTMTRIKKLNEEWDTLTMANAYDYATIGAVYPKATDAVIFDF